MFWTVSRAHECLWYLLTTKTKHSFTQSTHSRMENCDLALKYIKNVFLGFFFKDKEKRLSSNIPSQNSQHFWIEGSNKAKRGKKQQPCWVSRLVQITYCREKSDDCLEVMVAIGQFAEVPLTGWMNIKGDMVSPVNDKQVNSYWTLHARSFYQCRNICVCVCVGGVRTLCKW